MPPPTMVCLIAQAVLTVSVLWRDSASATAPAELVRTTMTAAVSETVEAVPPTVAALAKGAVPTLRMVRLPGRGPNRRTDIRVSRSATTRTRAESSSSTVRPSTAYCRRVRMPNGA